MLQCIKPTASVFASSNLINMTVSNRNWYKHGCIKHDFTAVHKIRSK